MGIIKKMLKQKAVYWPPAGVDQGGQPVYAGPLEIKCRWEERAVEYLKPDATPAVSQSVVFVDRDLELGGVLWLGLLDAVLDFVDPLRNEGAGEINGWSKVGNLRSTEFVRKAFL